MAPLPLWLQKHTDLRAHTSRTVPTCDIIERSLTSSKSEAGDFVELILL
jgi:hypothetical protein